MSRKGKKPDPLSTVFVFKRGRAIKKKKGE